MGGIDWRKQLFLEAIEHSSQIHIMEWSLMLVGHSKFVFSFFVLSSPLVVSFYQIRTLLPYTITWTSKSKRPGNIYLQNNTPRYPDASK